MPLEYFSALKKCIVFAFLMIGQHFVRAQAPANFDSSYYKTYPRQITGRVFLSKKYTALTLNSPENVKALRYRPNNAFSAGVGATYGAITVNLGFNMGFLDGSRKERGKTKFLDLQSHIFTRKLVADLYGQFYDGYYLLPKGLAAPPEKNYYLRPDLRVNMIGASVYRLMNHRKFSYRAAFLQNEWQKKSAGSLLIGAEIYTGIIRGDSSLVPTAAPGDYTQRPVNKVRFTEFGPGAGYAYTVVMQQHFFITGSLTLNADVSFVKEYTGTASEKRVSISPNLAARAVIGYNSETWSANLSWVNNRINLKGEISADQYLVRTGNLRLTYAKRFKPGKKLKKNLKIIDELPTP